jgi:Fic family protein
MLTISEISKYKYLLNTQFFNQYESWYLDSTFVSNEDIVNKIIEKYDVKEQFTNLFNGQTAFVKRIIYLKYIFNSTKILSNKHVSKLMCCSEETIRKHIVKLKLKI